MAPDKFFYLRARDLYLSELEQDEEIEEVEGRILNGPCRGADHHGSILVLSSARIFRHISRLVLPCMCESPSLLITLKKQKVAL